MTTLKRSKKTTAPKAKPAYEVRCAVLNGSATSSSPIAVIVRMYDGFVADGVHGKHDLLTGLLLALEVLTCLPLEELQRQLSLPAA